VRKRQAAKGALESAVLVLVLLALVSPVLVASE
jgi:hypothetical protein